METERGMVLHTDQEKLLAKVATVKDERLQRELQQSEKDTVVRKKNVFLQQRKQFVKYFAECADVYLGIKKEDLVKFDEKELRDLAGFLATQSVSRAKLEKMWGYIGGPLVTTLMFGAAVFIPATIPFGFMPGLAFGLALSGGLASLLSTFACCERAVSWNYCHYHKLMRDRYGENYFPHALLESEGGKKKKAPASQPEESD